MVRQISIGNDSFRKLRVLGSELVDKTRMVEQVCQSHDEIILFPRPRRFGKTFALSMLYEFFAIPTLGGDGKLAQPDARVLFEGLYLEQVWDKVQPHFQRYPTIVLNFKGMRFSTPEQWWRVLAMKLSDVAAQVRPLLKPLEPHEEEKLSALIRERASQEELCDSLKRLTGWLHQSTGQPALVLIDEYDAPIQDAWVKAHHHTPESLARLESAEERAEARREQRTAERLYDEVIGFFRAFFNNGLKTNSSVFKGILTGVLRISKESLFSGFNNVTVSTVMSREYADSFGFTEEEVTDLFLRRGQEPRLKAARAWYDGYTFGNTVIYNPWSILYYLHELPDFPKPYWLNTSENALIKQLLQRATRTTAEDFERLLSGGAVTQLIQDALSLTELAQDQEGLFNLLFWSGYLKAQVADVLDTGEARYQLSIPNLEVRMIFRDSFRGLLKAAEARGGLTVKALTGAILSGNDKVLKVLLQTLALNLMSVMDGDPNDPEAFYQGLMLGLCAWLEGDYRVRSNRETGLGRADVLILPKKPGQPGALLELKSTRTGKTLETLIRQGEQQVKRRNYAAELEASGATPLHRWVVAFDGKVLKVKKLKPELGPQG